MQFLYALRSIVLTLSLLLGIPTFGLLAYLTSQTKVFGERIFNFELVGLLASVLGILLWPVMLILPILRKNAVILCIVYELAAMLVLWVLWMTTAIFLVQWRIHFFPSDEAVYRIDCNMLYYSDWPEGVKYCHQFSTIQAFAITLFVITFLYFVALFTFALVSECRGRSVWKDYVVDLKLAADPTPTHPASQVTTGSVSIPPYEPTTPNLPQV
jgi:hypothetical protein